MNLKTLLKRFKSDECGAVTVDWVVLAAGVVGLAVIVGTTVTDGVNTAAGNISTNMTTSKWTTTTP